VLDHVERGRKHVAVVVCAKLLAGDAERGTRDAGGKKVYTVKVLVAQVPDVLLDDVPMRPVLPQGGAELRLVFDCACVVEAGHLKAERLAATARAEFQDGKTHLCQVELICRVSASG
jgi:hypothetical protein